MHWMNTAVEATFLTSLLLPSIVKSAHNSMFSNMLISRRVWFTHWLKPMDFLITWGEYNSSKRDGRECKMRFTCREVGSYAAQRLSCLARCYLERLSACVHCYTVCKLDVNTMCKHRLYEESSNSWYFHILQNSLYRFFSNNNMCL